MGPQKAVVTPASSAADTTVVSRTTRMSMPIDRAYPSPSRSALRGPHRQQRDDDAGDDHGNQRLQVRPRGRSETAQHPYEELLGALRVGVDKEHGHDCGGRRSEHHTDEQQRHCRTHPPRQHHDHHQYGRSTERGSDHHSGATESGEVRGESARSATTGHDDQRNTETRAGAGTEDVGVGECVAEAAGSASAGRRCRAPRRR